MLTDYSSLIYIQVLESLEVFHRDTIYLSIVYFIPDRFHDVIWNDPISIHKRTDLI